MKRLACLSLALLLTACGPVKNLDPLGGLGGEDHSRYGFESGVQGWAPAAEGGSCTQVMSAPGRSLFGQSSLALVLDQMGNHYSGSPICPGADDAGRASIDLSASPVDLSARTLSLWVYLPPTGQSSDSAPTQAQIYLVCSAGSVYGNGAGVNLVPNQWTRVNFSPTAWAGPGALDQNGVFLNAGFDPSSIKTVGVKFSASGAAPCSFAFSGVVLVDSLDW